MSIRCGEVRTLLIASTDRPRGEAAAHLESCSACAGFAERRDAAREMFREHRGDFEPDRHFADRVAARLPSPSEAALGWAVARVLPATLALLLVLLWLFLQTPSVTEAALEQSPTEDVLTWLLEPSGEDR